MRSTTLSRLAYRPLGAFRFFLALLVVLQHYAQWTFPAPAREGVMFAPPGNVAVLAFFVLSGFVIMEAADTIYRGRAGAFLANRLLRIGPLYVTAIVVSMVGLSLLAQILPLTDESGARPTADPFTAHNIAANLLAIVPMPGRWQPSIDFPFLRIAWALRVEVAYYISVATLLIAGAWLGDVPVDVEKRRAGVARLEPVGSGC